MEQGVGMDQAAVAALVRTRQTLHGIAECLLAGPEHRATGEIALRVTADGIATTAGPELRLAGADLVGSDGRRVAAAGTFAEAADALGVTFGKPDIGYPDGSGVSAADEIVLEVEHLGRITDWYALSDAALRQLAPDQEPILWPEHFDVAVLLDDRSYGSSPGDDFHPTPYAYVSARENDGSDFFNVSFGALLDADDVTGIQDLLAFWREGLTRLGSA